jgi:hypothetical protein
MLICLRFYTLTRLLLAQVTIAAFGGSNESPVVS